MAPSFSDQAANVRQDALHLLGRRLGVDTPVLAPERLGIPLVGRLDHLQIAIVFVDHLQVEAAHKRIWFVLRDIGGQLTQFAYPACHVFDRDAWILQPWLAALPQGGLDLSIAGLGEDGFQSCALLFRFLCALQPCPFLLFFTSERAGVREPLERIIAHDLSVTGGPAPVELAIWGLLSPLLYLGQPLLCLCPVRSPVVADTCS